MKGFFGSLLVFILWTGACIYYLSLSDDTVATGATGSSTIPITKKLDTGYPETNSPPKSQVPLNQLTENPLTPSKITTEVERTAVIEDPTLNLKKSPQQVDAQLLADEIKRTIAISDTIDIDRDEPELSLDDTIAIASGPSVSTEIFYPQYNNTDLVLDKRLVTYASELKALLEKHPEKKVTIIGHTDNVGNGTDNFQIALRKARQVKWYLTSRRGIPRKKVTAISRGEEEPIESNDNKWGRSKNNRIEVIID